MAPSALAECVKIEVSHDVGRQPGRQRLWRAWFVMLSLSGKGVVWGRCRFRWWAPLGGVSCQLHCWSQLQEWWKAAALRIMCEVTPGGEKVSSVALMSRGRLPSWHGWWSCWPGPWMSQWAAPGTQRRQLLAIGYAPFLLCVHCFFRVETFFCGLLLYLHCKIQKIKQNFF